MPARRPLIAGNWKMNLLGKDAVALAAALRMSAATPAKVDLVVCPVALHVADVARTLSGSAVGVGGQDCHANPSGAHTGDISAEMLADVGARWVIVGHSERRTDHSETDEQVRAKAAAGLRAGLTPIICVGETLAQRKAGETLDVLARQIAASVPPGASNVVIAYEPVWAIGTGLTPTISEIDEAHRHLRARLGGAVPDAQAVRILYGGSVKPSNAAEILGVADVDGALVGGASLKAADFLPIVAAA
ncbi:MAG: triose-phosphate isomerase [Alphaproteobacteria bacterium]|nr:triose-phosphate isomerase [Alphaproteobacteria bacterium]